MTTHGTGSIPSLEVSVHYTLPTWISWISQTLWKGKHHQNLILLLIIIRISMYIKHVETSHAYTNLSPPINHLFFPMDPHPLNQIRCQPWHLATPIGCIHQRPQDMLSCWVMQTYLKNSGELTGVIFIRGLYIGWYHMNTYWSTWILQYVWAYHSNITCFV